MLVRDVMTPHPITVQPEDNLHTVKDRMTAAHCRRLPVVDETGKVCGIITDRDLRLAMHSPLVMRERWQDDLLLENTLVAACMTAQPTCVTPDTPLEDAAELMLAHKIGGVPVLENDQLVGVLTATDLMRALIQALRTSG
ncbi:MAG: CBS domain-containing protein [Chloroflexi bacterium]|nr:CBS domain-containing protein [Chloroflexota bacterium]